MGLGYMYGFESTMCGEYEGRDQANGARCLDMQEFRVAKDIERAVRYISDGADGGDPKAWYYFGLLKSGFMQPEFVRSNQSQKDAANSFMIAAGQGVEGAIYRNIVGWMSHSDSSESCLMALNSARSLVDRRGRVYWDWLEGRKAEGDMDGYQVGVNILSRMGFERASVLSAKEAERRQDPDSAKVYYLLSAQRGNVESRVKVGDWWYYGGMGERGGEGWRGGLWKMAREMRETGIMEWMGIRDRNETRRDAVWRGDEGEGEGGTPNHKSIALSHYRFASPSSSQASYNLGYLYQFGIGTQPDYALAKRYYDMVKGESEFAAVVALGGLKWGELWEEQRAWWREVVERVGRTRRGNGGDTLLGFLKALAKKGTAEIGKVDKVVSKSSTPARSTAPKKILRTLPSVVFKHFSSPMSIFLFLIGSAIWGLSRFQTWRVERSRERRRRWEQGQAERAAAAEAAAGVVE